MKNLEYFNLLMRCREVWDNINDANSMVMRLTSLCVAQAVVREDAGEEIGRDEVGKMVDDFAPFLPIVFRLGMGASGALVLRVEDGELRAAPSHTLESECELSGKSIDPNQTADHIFEVVLENREAIIIGVLGGLQQARDIYRSDNN